MSTKHKPDWDSLGVDLKGELHTGRAMRAIYATDASIYREYPAAVVYPRHEQDIVSLVHFARKNGLSLIPRAAGTSLAGQVVGSGIVVDVSKYMTRILGLNKEKRTVTVQPGVIRDELNRYLAPHGLFFGPNTSTANRAMIGGMLGNSSCGSTSIRFGNTRDKVVKTRIILSDGSVCAFGPVETADLDKVRDKDGLEGRIYRDMLELLSPEETREQIREGFPKPSIHRRNTGYAIDLLSLQAPFVQEGKPFNLNTLLAGSEGTLGVATEITLKLDELPPSHERLVCAHFSSVQESLLAVQVAMKHRPFACELMDKRILDCTRVHPVFSHKRYFIQGDPDALLMIEMRGDSPGEAEQKAALLISAFKKDGYGYAWPVLQPPQSEDVWTLRKGGLGLLSNMPGDAKAVACIEDTAVDLVDLPNYIDDFRNLMTEFGQEAVYYAHAGAGELHLRPVLNLKTSQGQRDLRKISKASADLVKKYKGSLSGEHGDGRLRAEFIPEVIGRKNYMLLQQVKRIWDPDNIFNPGKIVDAPPMDQQLRYDPDTDDPGVPSIMDFSRDGGLLRAIEKCNGSGDCRKLHTSGGVMCPSYMATREETDTTRARANALREFYRGKGQNIQAGDVEEILDLCLSCKGCYAECPSNVDMASMKAEFFHQQHQEKGIPWRTNFFLWLPRMQHILSYFPSFLSPLINNRLLKYLMGIHPRRAVPFPAKGARDFDTFYSGKKQKKASGRSLVLFVDEFSQYLDTGITQAAISLLTGLGYDVRLYLGESGRIPLSKGVLNRAKDLGERHVRALAGVIGKSNPLVGLEPSAILTFCDEIPRIVGEEWSKSAELISGHSFQLEEFIWKEYESGFIQSGDFHHAEKRIIFHGHCHQKALSDDSHSVRVLGIPENYHVERIDSGCCGMAGSFGYEVGHYDVSMNIGELVLFPRIRELSEDTLIAANGTSCRQQIIDGTDRRALHPVEILNNALVK